ncbi:MAG: MaoC family dehydratase N-terminal domain-containing protein [Alphaproteobacteria bacterium]|nr:MaoC family dehydratase N-terminal domain-containing protein [Alphaproteobacteria bacterium]
MSTPWSEWVGRSEVRRDEVTTTPARALAATLDHPAFDDAPGAEIPGLWIWLYFTPLAPMREVGPDGHPKRGGFLPPIEAPRRMWAGSRCTFHAPLRLGQSLTRTSTITAITEKVGRAATLTFVTVRHVVEAGGAPVFEEEQDLVYMPIPERFEPPPPTPAPPAAYLRDVAVDPVLLFRFSALTFNGHRIHYDRAYAMETEKYPGLVVHGPLQAILMFDAALAHTPGRTPTRFEFRGLRPIFDFDTLKVGGAPRAEGGLDVFTVNGEGALGARGLVTFAD